MASIIGGIGTSHIPAIGAAIARGTQEDPYWKPFFDGYPPIREWLHDASPDVAIIFSNDHGLNFFLDKQPTFAIGAAAQYLNADEGWGLPTLDPYAGDPEFSWHLIESLITNDFDMTTCQEMLVDHAVTVPMSLLWPERAHQAVKIIPVNINTVQHPLPSVARCFALGETIGRAVASYPKDSKVVVLGTGGLSHQLDGQRAGFINKEFDEMCLDKIVNDPGALLDISIHDLVKESGTQGVEVINWLAMRGALQGQIKQLHYHYHIPVSNTASGLLLLENAA